MTSSGCSKTSRAHLVVGGVVARGVDPVVDQRPWPRRGSDARGGPSSSPAGALATGRDAQQQRRAAGAAPARAGASRSARGPSGRRQSPAGEIAQTEAARPALAISSAIQAPSELPATCGRSTPSRSQSSQTAAPRLAAVGAIPSGSAAESPKPGQVDRDHVTLGREQVEDRIPDPLRAAEPVDQDERLAGAASLVAELHRLRPLFESRLGEHGLQVADPPLAKARPPTRRGRSSTAA